MGRLSGGTHSVAPGQMMEFEQTWRGSCAKKGDLAMLNRAYLSSVLILALFLVWGCSNTENDPQQGGDDTVASEDGVAQDIVATEDGSGGDDTAPEPDLVGEDLLGQPDTEPEPDIPVLAGVGTKVVFSIHNAAGQQGLDLTEMQAKDDISGGFDVLVSKSGAGPVILLGDGVTAQNLGNGSAFDDVDEVPADNYAADADGAPVIGASWRDGGSGQTGFTMTSNVYAIKRTDETYAKMMVLSAKGGNIEVVFFYQPDGSTNVATQDSL